MFPYVCILEVFLSGSEPKVFVSVQIGSIRRGNRFFFQVPHILLVVCCKVVIYCYSIALPVTVAVILVEKTT